MRRLPQRCGGRLFYFGLLGRRKRRGFGVAMPRNASSTFGSIIRNSMDLTDEQEAALSTLQEAFDDPDTFDAALQEHAENYRQPAFDDGHQQGFGEVNRKLEKAQQEAKQAKERVSEKEEQIESLREEQPDLQQKRQEWEQNELQPMKEQVQDLRSKLTDGKKETVQQKLVSELQPNTKNEWVAKQAVQSHSDRIQVQEDGEVQFLREDGETPYPSSNGKSPMERFRDDIVGSLPDDVLADNTQGGTERSIDGSPSSGGGGTLTKSDMSDKEKSQFIRENSLDEYQNLPDE